MIASTTGLILRTRPLTETSLIVHWLTPDFGRLATVAKGARRTKSPFAGKLDLFYDVDFSFSRSRHSDLHQLREVAVREMNGVLRQDLFRLRQAAYAAALIELATETETPLTNIYQMLREFLEQLCREKIRPKLALTFELKFLRELGLEPDLKQTALTTGAQKIVGMMTQQGWETVSRLELTAAQVIELRQFLHDFLILHLGRVPKGRAQALENTN